MVLDDDDDDCVLVAAPASEEFSKRENFSPSALSFTPPRPTLTQTLPQRKRGLEGPEERERWKKRCGR